MSIMFGRGMENEVERDALRQERIRIMEKDSKAVMAQNREPMRDENW